MDFYFIIQDLQKETKKKILIHFFPPTKLSEKELCVNLEILVVVALKDGSRKYKEPHQGTSEPRDWTPVRSCYLQQQQKNNNNKRPIGPPPSFSVS